MLPFNRSWIHQLDRGRVTVRRSSGTITPYLVAQRYRATLKGGTYGLFCRPKVPCDTQRRHLRLILSPEGAVRHSKTALTAYSVAQRCRATLKGGTYGLFCRPKVPCDTQRRHLRGLFVAREHSDKLSREQNAPFRSRDNLGRPFREQNAPFRSRDILGRPFREQNTPFRSRDDLGRPSREQNTPFRSRDNLGRPSRERIAPFRSRDNLGRPLREQIAPSRSRDILGRPFREQNAAFRSRGNLGAVVRYRNSTGTLRALLDAAEVRPEPVRLIERLGAFRDGDLDG